MALDQTKLEKLLLKNGTEKKVVKFFQGASEADRKTIAGFCAKNFKKRVKEDRENWDSDDFDADNDLLSPALYAAYGACTLKQIGTSWDSWLDGDLFCELLLDRKPGWINQWAEVICKQLRVRSFVDLRRMIRAGICEKPQTDNYTRLMISGLSYGQKPQILKLIKKDPDLLKEDIWRIFEVPYVMHHENLIGYLDNDWIKTLAALTKEKKLDRKRVFESCFSATNMGFNRSQVTMFFTLHDLLKPTPKEQQAMFDSYCGLLDSSIPPVVKFGFETLQKLDTKSPQDELKLCDALSATMRSPTKSMLKSTMTWLAKLIKRNEKCRETACMAAVQGLLHEKSDVQTDVLKFLQKHAGQPSPELLDEIDRIGSTTSASVKKAIAKWTKELAQSDSRGDSSSTGKKAKSTTAKSKTDTSKAAKTVASNSKSVTSESLAEAIKLGRKMTKKIAPLVGMPELLSAVKKRELVIPSVAFDGTELARLWNREPVSPIKTLEEFVDVAARGMENGDLVEDGERVIEAVSRLKVFGDEKKLKVVDPVIKHALKRLKRYGSSFEPFNGVGISDDVVPLIIAWATDAPYELYKPDRPPGLGGFMALRMSATLTRLMERTPLELVALPTHSDGWIDPLVLVKRLKKIKNEKHMLNYDQVLALLRLAPENRGKALKAAKDIPGEFAQAFRYACGEQTKKIGKSYYLWIAAARARNPFDDDLLVAKKFPDHGADAGLAAKYDLRRANRKKKSRWDELTTFYAEGSVRPRYDREKEKDWGESPYADYLVPTALIHEDDWHSNNFWDTKPYEDKLILYAASVWPQARESFFLITYKPIVNLQPLFDTNTPLLEVGTWALVRALGGNWPAEKAMGIDVAIATIEDGRWDSKKAGRMLALEITYANRYAKSLPEVAAVSPLHAFQICQSLISMLAAKPPELPSSFGGLLEVIYELLEELQISVENESAIEFLSSLKGSSKAAKAARKILGFEVEDQLERESNLDSIYDLAIRGRLGTERRLAGK